MNNPSASWQLSILFSGFASMLFGIMFLRLELVFVPVIFVVVTWILFAEIEKRPELKEKIMLRLKIK